MVMFGNSSERTVLSTKSIVCHGGGGALTCFAPSTVVLFENLYKMYYYDLPNKDQQLCIQLLSGFHLCHPVLKRHLSFSMYHTWHQGKEGLGNC